jgi:hypothetical protein
MGIKLITLATTALVLSTGVNAAIISADWHTAGDNLITQDTVSGLSWLDLTETTNISYNQMLLQVGVGGQFEGWTVASYSDAEELFDNAGGDGNYPGVQSALASNLLPLWGVTGHTTDTTWFNVSDISENPGSTSSGTFFDLDGFMTYSSNLAGVDSVFPGIGTALYRVSAVPVPAAAWLFGSGLIGLIGLARRKA